METIEVKFTDLRRITESVTNFIKSEYWWEKDSNLKTSIENDLGITGMDSFELMEKFAEKFDVNLEEFEFDKYFGPEGIDLNPLDILLLIMLLIVFLVKLALATVVFIFDKALSKQIYKHETSKRIASYLGKQVKERDNLIVGDLVVTAIKGKFTKRAEIKIKLIK